MCAAALAMAWLPVQAADRVNDVAVKAAYLVRFLPFVEWPVPGTGPLVIGVFAHEDMVRHLEAILPGRRVSGREVQLRRVQASEAHDNLNAIFLGQPLQGGRLADSLKGQPVLVVADGGLPDGAMLGFVIVDGRVGFEASPAAAARVGLKLGARLLAIAERVQR
jgi:hypothetical protein